MSTKQSSSTESDSSDDSDDSDGEVTDQTDTELEKPSTLLSDNSSIVEDVLLRRPSTVTLRNWYIGVLPARNQSEKKTQKYNGKALIPKFVKCLKALFRSKSFYFSYDLDLTNSLASGVDSGPTRRCYCFNGHMSKAFSGTSLELPILQGFVGLTKVPVKREGTEFSASVIIISRRSVLRAGVRYLRRGIDDNGNCANWVETEQLLHYGDNSVCSYTQVRGSIPIYFSQSPYSLKPVPKISRKIDDTFVTFSRHMNRIRKTYGDVLSISLVEKAPSGESQIGQAYADLADENGFDLEWFDFHQVCRGMRFDRVETLFETQVGDKLQRFGWTDLSKGKKQTGVFRVNCIDCLDRTNVVETFCAKRILQQQIESLGLEIIDNGKFETELNGIWADNGDAISLQYSSTSALKGDFTRTKKRNYRGVLTDAFLTLSRYFYGMVTDFFTQTVLDYILGYVDEGAFDEFEEHLQSSDPSINLDSVRQSAVDLTSEIVIASDKEIIYGGWWLLTPKNRQTGVRRSQLVDKIFLVTNTALYICEFDIKQEKVLSFDRIPSEQVTKIQKGHFFCEAVSRVSRDPAKNVGILIEYNDSTDIVKSGDNKVSKVNVKTETKDIESKDPESLSYVAFKVPWLQLNEYDDVFLALRKTCPNAEILSKDIVSLDEAKSDTSLWNVLQHRFKKAVWA
ncbi:hypothetical protein TRICI_000178 [Trichomonascus ciferrii]|uniref:SAC domain-containing protein n=1 Tax=Trichomonascus ciferrii TaxID=44093 RepID=A0A642VE59_9ASCO|nr:hypothetical protein TRICI_000178 [Trichomonascus ciferrii]